jgi:hypothetical protein
MKTTSGNGPEITFLTSQMLLEISGIETGPCLSLYQPTNRRHPENQEDPIRFRNLVKALEGSLQRRFPSSEAKQLLEPFHALAQDTEFWNHAREGLAVLGAPGLFRALRVSQPVDELVVVADSFHTKPLQRFLQTAERYHVLYLSLHGVRLFEGNRRALDEVDMTGAGHGTGRQSTGETPGEAGSGRVEKAELSAPDADDMLDDLGELVTRMGGTVLVVPAERVALPSGLAATYRY